MTVHGRKEDRQILSSMGLRRKELVLNEDDDDNDYGYKEVFGLLFQISFLSKI